MGTDKYLTFIESLRLRKSKVNLYNNYCIAEMYKPPKTSKTNYGFVKADTLSDSVKKSPFQQFVSAKEKVLPKFQTDETEKKYLQASGANVTEEDLYDPLNPTEEVEPPKPKKKRKRTRWDVDEDKETAKVEPKVEPVIEANKK